MGIRIVNPKLRVLTEMPSKTIHIEAFHKYIEVYEIVLKGEVLRGLPRNWLTTCTKCAILGQVIVRVNFQSVDDIE